MEHDKFHSLIPKPRLIDLDSRKRTKPMKVLCLGLSRTGTFSMWLALQKLGYTPYHMAEAMRNPQRDFALWGEALNAKYKNKGAPFGKEEFDILLGEFDAVLDIPCALFIDELTKAYPDAKVILTNRSFESWQLSMAKTAGQVLSWKSWPYVSSFDPSITGPWYRFTQQVTDAVLLQDQRTWFEEHYAHVRAVVPKDNLLEFNLGDSWEPLCEFLDLPVPKGKYPRTNDGSDFQRLHRSMWNQAFVKMVGKIGAGAVLATAVVGVVWIYRVKGMAGFRRS